MVSPAKALFEAKTLWIPERGQLDTFRSTVKGQENLMVKFPWRKEKLPTPVF